MIEKNSRDLEVARDFLRRVSIQLDLDPALIDELSPHMLGLTKRVAHEVVRPAAPLAAFLVGCSVAQAGDSGEGNDAVARALAAIEAVDSVMGKSCGQA